MNNNEQEMLFDVTAKLNSSGGLMSETVYGFEITRLIQAAVVSFTLGFLVTSAPLNLPVKIGLFILYIFPSVIICLFGIKNQDALRFIKNRITFYKKKGLYVLAPPMPMMEFGDPKKKKDKSTERKQVQSLLKRTDDIPTKKEPNEPEKKETSLLWKIAEKLEVNDKNGSP